MALADDACKHVGKATLIGLPVMIAKYLICFARLLVGLYEVPKPVLVQHIFFEVAYTSPIYCVGEMLYVATMTILVNV